MDAPALLHSCLSWYTLTPLPILGPPEPEAVTMGPETGRKPSNPTRPRQLRARQGLEIWSQEAQIKPQVPGSEILQLAARS